MIIYKYMKSPLPKKDLLMILKTFQESINSLLESDARFGDHPPQIKGDFRIMF